MKKKEGRKGKERKRKRKGKEKEKEKERKRKRNFGDFRVISHSFGDTNNFRFFR